MAGCVCNRWLTLRPPPTALFHRRLQVKPIGPGGARFDMALFEGTGAIEPVGDRPLRLGSGDRQWLVLLAGDEALEVEGIVAEAECACVEMREGRAVRAWVVENRRLTIDGAEWFVSDTPADREIRGPADD
jgi:hypothetical protein